MKGNLMVRLMTGLILIGIALAQVTGQTDLLSANWLWLAILPAVMGFQATFTGWCPAELIGKLSKSGECCPGGSCGTASVSQKTTKSQAKNDGSTDENATTCCGDGEEEQDEWSGCCSESAPSRADAGGHDSQNLPGLVIQVLGTGCKTCHNTVTRIEETAGKMGVQVTVQKVEDVAEIASYGVTATPGVVIGETLVHSGGLPSVSQIKQWLAEATDQSGKQER
ncbi:MTH895/ArsE family thioredoxin-like protein [Thiomicrospira sp. WB1]|uniref:MTH895/ArsE family thioredoxin-like protein n=1 Tax=Thiomicrospira sp. WB1 TaxID=1685380 RepID=UPI0009E78E8E|nr:MTH895/ArsE family thioredoxin-like protein [Thiomicrospira sp. WB1]